MSEKAEDKTGKQQPGFVDPADWLGDKIAQVGTFLGKAFAENIPATDKIREFSELVGRPTDPADDERIDLVDPEFARAEFQKLWPADLYFRPEISGCENIPETGGAVLVSNHVTLAIDTMMLSKVIFDETGRLIRPTVDKFTIQFPYFREWVMQMGCVLGSRDNALRMCEAGELVLSYPGGAREALKPGKDAYKLMWQGATGFVKVAIKTGVPIIPIASVGGDEAFATLAEDNVLARKFMNSVKYTAPLFAGLGPLPLPVKFYFAVGAPIVHDLKPRHAEDEQAVAELHARAREELENLVDETQVRRGPSAFG